MKVLGIETSCDETAVAIIDDDKTILAHHIASQIDEHALYGGVVPEIAARAHMEKLDYLVTKALSTASLTLDDINAFAVTAGPGLIGGVIVGVMYAKAFASVCKKPIIAVNHLEGHALVPRLTNNIEFPFLLLLTSGGHCQFLRVAGTGTYEKLGTTLDDALGEAFDKVAKMLGLGYPGGPIVEQRALDGNPTRFHFPRSLKGRKDCNFSFSGLKTAVRKAIAELPTPLTDTDINDICASFQVCVCDILTDRINYAMRMYETHHSEKRLVLSGGVAANKAIRHTLETICTKRGYSFDAPPINLCTDNGVMIAWAGIERLQQGWVDNGNFAPRARWPLDETFGAQ